MMNRNWKFSLIVGVVAFLFAIFFHALKAAASLRQLFLLKKVRGLK